MRTSGAFETVREGFERCVRNTGCAGTGNLRAGTDLIARRLGGGGHSDRGPDKFAGALVRLLRSHSAGNLTFACGVGERLISWIPMQLMLQTRHKCGGR